MEKIGDSYLILFSGCFNKIVNVTFETDVTKGTKVKHVRFFVIKNLYSKL